MHDRSLLPEKSRGIPEGNTLAFDLQYERKEKAERKSVTGGPVAQAGCRIRKPFGTSAAAFHDFFAGGIIYRIFIERQLTAIAAICYSVHRTKQRDSRGEAGEK